MVPPGPPDREFSVETPETSVIARSWIRPSDSTTEREVERDAKLLEGDCLDAIFRYDRDALVWPFKTVEMESTPPEINVADSPEIRCWVGSASVFGTPGLFHRAKNTAWTDGIVPAPAMPKAIAAGYGTLFAMKGLVLLKLTVVLPTFNHGR